MTDEQKAGTSSAPESPVASVPPIATVTTISPMFKMVFLGVLGLTVVLLLVNVALAVMLNNPSEAETDLTQTVQTGWQVGFSAVVGLIGGKALS